MTSPHRLNYGSIDIERQSTGDSGACVVTVRARCTCGYELNGMGDCFVEADHLLQQALAAHVAAVAREQGKPDALEG